MKHNIITLTDSYKVGHYNMYPKDTEIVYSYFESRKGALYNETEFFGLQYISKEYLLGRQVTNEKIKRAKEIIDIHLGPGVFNEDGWKYILNKYDGCLPIKIMAVPEGLPIPTNNVLMTVQNTDPKCWWLTNYLETLLSHVWSSSTVASLSREVKIMCKYYLEQTSDNMDVIDFMLHDFGFRGVSSVESAGICGAGHLTNFKGTDTIRAIEYAMDYYNSGVCAYSVPATEHSIMTSLGPDGESKLFSDLLDEYPKGILSVVIDSYDYKNFIDSIARKHKDKVLSRDGKTVFRPDSGDPVSTTLRVLELLDSVFGSTVNSKGYRVLNSKVGALWGDGIDYMGVRNILHAMKAAGWSAENIVFGMGGGLLQKINRDTQRFAFKCSAQRRNGNWYDIYKKPLDITKESKKGFQYLYKFEGSHGSVFKTVNKCDYSRENILLPVFENGNLLIDYKFDEIRYNARIR